MADSSLGYDLGRKAEVYALFAIAELWVIDARSLETHVFSQPSGGRYVGPVRLSPSQPLVPAFSPELAVTLANLQLD